MRRYAVAGVQIQPSPPFLIRVEPAMDPKKFHKQQQQKKREDAAEKAKEGAKEKKKYSIVYDGAELSFEEKDSLGKIEYSKKTYLIFEREKLLSNKEKRLQSAINKALGNSKFAAAKAEDGIKILSDQRKGGTKGQFIFVELKVFGNSETTDGQVWNWRAVGVKDDKQSCVFFLAETSEAHEGAELKKLCEEVGSKLLPSNNVEGASCKAVKNHSKSK